MSDTGSERAPTPVRLRPGATPYRLDRYTANVIEEVRAETDNKIDILNNRISGLENTLIKIVGMSEKTPDMFQNMSGLVQDLADQQKEIMKTMKMLATVVNQMMLDQTARDHADGRHSTDVFKLGATPAAIAEAYGRVNGSSSPTELDLQSLNLDDPGPSNHPSSHQSAPGSSSKGKGKKGRKR